LVFSIRSLEVFDSLTNMPSDHDLDPGKKEIKAIESLDQGGGAAGRNPARPAALLAGEVAGLDHVLT
jgi:hypothetical protein